MKNEVIELLVITSTQDADGFPQKTIESFECFADIQSAKRSEFYAAASAGINVSIVAIVNLDDYKAAYTDTKPNFVRYDGDVYQIKRTYRKKAKGTIELTLVEAEGNG